MRVAAMGFLWIAAGLGATELEVYQVRGKLAVVETEARPGEGGPRRGATRFTMVLETDKTLDFRLADEEFKPLFDEAVASSRRRVRPGYRGPEGTWLPLDEAPEGSLGALVAGTLGEGDALGFFDFRGLLRLRQDYHHPWARERTRHLVGELCVQEAQHEGARWRGPEGACRALLVGPAARPDEEGDAPEAAR